VQWLATRILAEDDGIVIFLRTMHAHGSASCTVGANFGEADWADLILYVDFRRAIRLHTRIIGVLCPHPAVILLKDSLSLEVLQDWAHSQYIVS
jgi:hypothetical protein